MSTSEQVEELKSRYLSCRNSLERYYRADERRECATGTVVEKGVSNRGLGRLVKRDAEFGRAHEKVAAYASGDASVSRGTAARSLDRCDEFFGQVLRGLKRWCALRPVWLERQRDGYATASAYVRGFIVGAKSAPKTEAASAAPMERPLKVTSWDECTAAPPEGGKVAERLQCCVLSAAHEAGVSFDALKFYRLTGDPNALVIEAPDHKIKVTVFSGTDDKSFRAACRRIYSVIDAMTREPMHYDRADKPPFPKTANVLMLLAAMGRAPETTTAASLMEEAEKTYLLTGADKTRIISEHLAAVKRAMSLGLEPSPAVLREHAIEAPKAHAPTREALESLVVTDLQGSDFIAKMHHLPLPEADKLFADLAARVNKANKGVDDVYDGSRPFGVTTSEKEVDRVKRSNADREAAKRLAVIPVKVPFSKNKTESFWVYAGAAHVAAATEFAKTYAAFIDDSFHNQSAVTPERHAAVSRALGYTDAEIREFFLKQTAREVLRERRSGEKAAAKVTGGAEKATERPAETAATLVGFPVRFARRAGGNIEVAFKSKPDDGQVELLKRYGYDLVTDGDGAPFWRAPVTSADAKTLASEFGMVFAGVKTVPPPPVSRDAADIALAARFPSGRATWRSLDGYWHAFLEGDATPWNFAMVNGKVDMEHDFASNDARAAYEALAKVAEKPATPSVTRATKSSAVTVEAPTPEAASAAPSVTRMTKGTAAKVEEPAAPAPAIEKPAEVVVLSDARMNASVAIREALGRANAEVVSVLRNAALHDRAESLAKIMRDPSAVMDDEKATATARAIVAELNAEIASTNVYEEPAPPAPPAPPVDTSADDLAAEFARGMAELGLTPEVE